MRDIVTHNIQLSSVSYKVFSSISAAVRLSSRYYWMICYLFTQTVFHLRPLSANRRLLHVFSWDNNRTSLKSLLLGRLFVTNANYMLETLFCIHACDWCITEKCSHTSKRHHTHVDFTRHSARCVNIKEISPTLVRKNVFYVVELILGPKLVLFATKTRGRKYLYGFLLAIRPLGDVPFAKLYY